MGNRPALIKQIDVKRAVKGTLDAGFEIGRVEVEGGKVVIFPKSGDDKSQNGNTWDEVLEE